jgi:hypothetical protein
MPVLLEDVEQEDTAGGFLRGETWLHEAYTGVDRDDLGNVTSSFAAPVSVGGCGFAPGTSSEVAGLRVVTAPTLYVPKPLTVNPQDRFTGRGKVYEVVGDAADWLNPISGRDPGKLVVPLQRITG